MTTRIVFEFQQPPAATDVALLTSLAERLNAVVVELPGVFQTIKKARGERKNGNNSTLSNRTSKQLVLPMPNLNFEKFPEKLDDFAVKPELVESLANVFDDEPSAEVLCEMLAS